VWSGASDCVNGFEPAAMLWLTTLCRLLCAFKAVTSQTWIEELDQQVSGALYVLQNGANTSQLVQGHTVDPFVQDEEAVPAAVLVAQGEHLHACICTLRLRRLGAYNRSDAVMLQRLATS